MPATPNLEDLALNSTRLIDKADALIARNRGDGINVDEELPVLTDQIDSPSVGGDFTGSPPPMDPIIDLDLLSEPISAVAAASQISSPPEPEPEVPIAVEPGLDPQHVTEKLIELDAYLAQTLNNWINDELPGIIQSEMGSMIERIRNQTLSHMRATLLAQVSDKLVSVLDETLNKK